VSRAERCEFEAYGRTFGLDPAGLLALLLSRELRLGGFMALIEADVPPAEARDMKVTVHGRHPELRAGVSAWAAAAGTSVSNACAVLIRAELRDQWLNKVLATRIESL
jgi:hypothetical protein